MVGRELRRCRSVATATHSTRLEQSTMRTASLLRWEDSASASRRSGGSTRRGRTWSRPVSDSRSSTSLREWPTPISTWRWWNERSARSVESARRLHLALNAPGETWYDEADVLGRPDHRVDHRRPFDCGDADRSGGGPLRAQQRLAVGVHRPRSRSRPRRCCNSVLGPEEFGRCHRAGGRRTRTEVLHATMEALESFIARVGGADSDGDPPGGSLTPVPSRSSPESFPTEPMNPISSSTALTARRRPAARRLRRVPAVRRHDVAPSAGRNARDSPWPRSSTT